MHTTNLQKFKGEIENYVNSRNNIFESRIQGAFSFLNFKTLLSRTRIQKKEGYHAGHLLFILTLLPLLKIDTIHSFCLKQWYHWSTSKKDSFYRFKQRNYRWRSFMYKVISNISTDTRLHASTIIKKYTKLWTVEVCFKETRQLLGFGKDQSNDFNAQVCATTLSFLRYNLLNFLNKNEGLATTGDLFQQLADESATITYAQRLWDFFRGLFNVTISKIFDLFKIEEEGSSYFHVLTATIYASTPIQGCETCDLSSNR